jgi:hypothetical protein
MNQGDNDNDKMNTAELIFTIATLNDSLKAERLAFHAMARKRIAEGVEKMRKQLQAVGWDLAQIVPRTHDCTTRAAFLSAQANRNRFAVWFQANDIRRTEWLNSLTPEQRAERQAFSSGSGKRTPCPDFVFERAGYEATLEREAAKATEAYFDGWVNKLARKIGARVSAATVTGDLWSGSTLNVTLDDGTRQTWTTKCILNVSVYGKLFNQWPTRRTA